MDHIQQVLANIIKTKDLQNEQELHHYDCNTCNDAGYIFFWENNKEYAKKCTCLIKKEEQVRINNSGIGDLIKTKNLDNFETVEDHQKIIKERAIEYLQEFGKGNRYSLAMLGQSAIGKSHILTAVSGELLNAGVRVKFYVADEIIKKLQSSKYDELNYINEFHRIADAEVLYIDDLFKSSITNYYKLENIKQEDLREIFQVINYRYNKKLPLLISSEIHFERFADIDEAIIGRINEMCNYKYIVSVKPDKNKNYRLNKRGE